MNRLSSQQRKLTYFGGMLLLLIPIIWLGTPSGRTPGSGGTIARLREQLDMGESDLGELDPSGSAMNFALLGLRGVAANILWMQADEQKNHKDWPAMRTTTESIIRLQPHFVKVWEYNGWNLAYNVSVEWDAVPDRYFWVKEGGKFLMKGVERNRRSPDLHWHVGRVYGPKIGLSDEARYFRRYFLQDPGPEFNNGLDRDWNARGEDNYLVAKDWFSRANEAELKTRQSIMDRTIFRSYPGRSQLDYATALQKYGYGEELDRETAGRKLSDAEQEALQDRIREKLRDQTREAWSVAFDDWTKKYGGELFTVDFIGHIINLRLEMTDAEIKDLAKTPDDVAWLRRAVNQYQNMTNYRYWRTRALCEAEPQTADAHWLLFAAKEQYRKQNLSKAQELAEQSMVNFEKVLNKYPELTDEDQFVEQCLTAILIWQYVHRLAGERVPEDFPLKSVWQSKQEVLPEIQSRFDRMFAQ